MNINEILKNIEHIEYIGSDNVEIDRVVDLTAEDINSSSLLWVSDKYKEKVKTISAGTVILTKAAAEYSNKNCNYIITSNPRRAFKEVLELMYPEKTEAFIAPSASIDKNAKVHANVYIGHNVVIEGDVEISEGVKIDSNTVIKERTKIGNNVVIGANCTIGGVGFGYEKNDKGEYELIKHIAGVKIEEDVEIGNNTTIDRGVLKDTVLRRNSKIDNLVHIAHGVDVGENAMVIANSMVAGSVNIGANSWIAPSSSIINGKNVGKDAIVGLGAVVVKHVEDGSVVVGNPAKVLSKK